MTATSVRLVNGDALEGIEQVASESIDLVITSPPYNINLKSRNAYTENYFDNLNEGEYRNKIGMIVRGLARVVKPRGSIWINMKSRWLDSDGRTVSAIDGSLEPPTWMLDYSRRAGLFLKNLVIWNYDINSDTQNNKFHPRYEFFFWFVKHPKEYKFYLDRIRVEPKTKDKRNNPAGANPTDVWYFPLVKGNSKERNNHPAQFPEKMVERIITSCSDEGDTVLDPFFGSGTVLAMAANHGRNALGFEIEKVYVEPARLRLMRLENVVSKKINLHVEVHGISDGDG